MKGEIAVRYTIRHFDLPLLTFEANMDSADTGLHFIKVYEENRSFLPLNLTVSEDGVERWLRHRTIPKNRAYVDALLSKVGLSLNRPLGIIAANYQTLGQNFVDALEDMLVFDAIICNTDRHYGNFGVLVDNKTNTIAAPAPLFDHGNSLFSLGGTDLWDNQKAFDEYARTLLPLAYDDFFAAAKSAMKPRHRAMLHKLLDFHFDRRATRYNLPPNRLKMIEKEVQRRARVLLG